MQPKDLWRKFGGDQDSANKGAIIDRVANLQNPVHRWNRNPRPQPQKFNKLVFLIQFSWSYISLNWLSVALVGVWGSDFIGQQTKGAIIDHVANLQTP